MFFRILLLVLLVSACSEGESSEQPLINYLDAAVFSEDYSGAVLMARGDAIFLKTARGWANRDLSVPLTPDHIFRIGSLSKPLTAAAVLVAVEKGVLSLDDPLCKFLNPCPEPWTPVTLKNLLGHSSGIGDFFEEMEEVPLEDTKAEIERVIANPVMSQALEFEAGSAYAYRNFNFVLLAYVLEVVTGDGWEDYLKAEIFDPLHMTGTRYDRVYDLMAGRVTGYIRQDGEIKNILYDDHAAYAAGGLASTVGDIYTFLHAFMTGGIVPPELVTLATTPGIGDYGLGFAIRPYFGKKVFTHTGGIDGFSTVMFYYPDEDLYLIVFNNTETDAAILRACDLSARFFNWPTRYEPGADNDLTPQARCGLE